MTEKNWLLFEWTLPNALEANKLMALCKRSGLMAWTINTCLRTKTAKLSLITSLCTKPIKTWTYLLKEADLLSYWRWYVLFTLWTALERHPQISAVQLKILVQVCKSVLKKKKRERQFRKISNTVVNYWKEKDCCCFPRQEVFCGRFIQSSSGTPSPNLTVQKGLPQSSPDEMFN